MQDHPEPRKLFIFESWSLSPLTRYMYLLFFLSLCLMMRFIQYDKIFRNSILWITYKMSFNVYVNDFELVDLIGIRKNKSPKYRSHSGSLSIGPREWWGILWFNQKIDIFVLHASFMHFRININHRLEAKKKKIIRKVVKIKNIQKS